MITLESASLVYSDHGREVFACKDVDLRLERGEFLGILGPSGSGKSSLLYLLSGMKSPTRGRVVHDGVDYATLSDKKKALLRQSTFGFVFQYPFLVGYLSALENVLAARPDVADAEQAKSLLDHVGLGSKLRRLPHEMSGGEKQRVCVARALFGNPEVLFCDEPTAALDHRTGAEVMALLRENRGAGTLVVVTHDPTMLEGADRIVRMSDGCLDVEHPAHG